jgi:hypothetical protein
MRRRKMESEEQRTLKQDMKSIEEGGNYLDEVRYPEVRVFTYLWGHVKYESIAEITEGFQSSTEGLNAFNAEHCPGASPFSIMPQFLVEECLRKLSCFQILKTKVENGVKKYRMDHATAKANRWAPYVNKLMEELD